MMYTDQTGWFPAVSSCGYKHIMILVEVDGNYIAMETMKSKEMSKLVRGYNSIIKQLAQKRIKLAKQMLDNEASMNIWKPSKVTTLHGNSSPLTITGAT